MYQADIVNAANAFSPFLCDHISKLVFNGSDSQDTVFTLSAAPMKM